MSSYDPEIDPSIRLEEEELARLQEEELAQQAQQREMERTINEILDRREQRAAAASSRQRMPLRRERFSGPAQPDRESDTTDEQTDSDAEERPSQRVHRQRKLAEQSKGFLARIFSGSFLDTPWMREHYTYLVSGVVLLLVYLMCSFSVQRLHHTRQVLERQLYNTRTDAVNMSRKAKSVSGRSAVTKRVKEMGLDLDESLQPVKVIEK